MNVSNGNLVEDVIAEDLIVPIIIWLYYPAFLLWCLCCDSMLNECKKKPQSDCTYSGGLYTVGYMVTRREKACNCCALCGSSICYLFLYQIASFIAYRLHLMSSSNGLTFFSFIYFVKCLRFLPFCVVINSVNGLILKNLVFKLFKK